MKTDFNKNALRLLLTLVLLSLGVWTFYYCSLQRTVRLNNYTYSSKEAERLKNYPKAMYAHGLDAWARQDPEKADRFFRQTVSNDVLFIDGWLRLAEAEAAMGRKEKAKKILLFTIDLTKHVFRWKWSQMLLARELGMEDVIYRNAKYLLSRGVLEQDTLQFLHTHLDGNASAVVSVLNKDHLESYLDWLMKWTKTDESLVVWDAMAKVAEPEKEIAMRYANFLMQHKHITESRDIWQKYTGSIGMTNSGFEAESTCKAFDWCYWNENNGNYDVKRDDHDTYKGKYSLRVNFRGRENISFRHVYQIFTVDPLETYRLSYVWKSREITTDKGPFVEIYGYDKEGLYRNGPMITGTQDWRKVSIDFDMPEGCRAAVVRLRRQPSGRFDSKIRGTLWLDDFRLEKIGNNIRRFSKVITTSPSHRSPRQNENLYLSKR